jgi:hypothetical protein
MFGIPAAVWTTPEGAAGAAVPLARTTPEEFFAAGPPAGKTPAELASPAALAIMTEAGALYGACGVFWDRETPVGAAADGPIIGTGVPHGPCTPGTIRGPWPGSDDHGL